MVKKSVNSPAYAKALTVYLLIPEIIDPLDAVSGEPMPDLHGISVIPGEEWVLCIRNSNSKRPEWIEFFSKIFDTGLFGFNSSVSALLLIPSAGRLWAITFGRGRFLLRDGVIEERFGLRTALNAIDSDKVRAITKETFDSFASQAQQQAADDTEFDNFGVNVDRDLLYAVAGVPRERGLGRRLAGKDSLCASVKVQLGDLSSYLSLLHSFYVSDYYKDNFLWVDNIYEVRDKSLKRTLDVRLASKLRARNLEKAWLALPEIVDWQRIRGFSYANPASRFIVEDLHLMKFLDSLEESHGSIDILAIKRRRVVCLDHDNEKIDSWSAYRCLYAEISIGEDVFLLTNGHWYKINGDIVHDIDEWYEHVKVDTDLLPPMLEGEREDGYNNRIGGQRNYQLFHGSVVYLPNRGKIEFCDLSVQRDDCYDLIHVKRFGPSSKLSHLFYQGTNSARLFRTSPEFRKSLSASLTRDKDLAERLAREPIRLEYRVVFAIASSSTAPLELPIFSKLSLRQAIRELEGLGFRTSVAKILAPPEERMVEKSKKIAKVF